MVGPMVFVLVVTRLWGNLAGTTDLETVYPTRSACEHDKRYFDEHQPDKRVYAECRAVHFSEDPTIGEVR